MIYLYGASGHAKVIVELLELEQKSIGGLVDENPCIASLLGFSVYNTCPENFEIKKDSFIVSIGDNTMRKKVVNQLGTLFSIATHTNATISKRATIGEGTVIMSGVSVNSDCRIGKHVILNTNCSVDHDSLIDDFVHLSPNVAVAGDVSVGEGTHIGIGASVIQGITIGKWATIGAGAVIIRNVPDYACVVGNPGKILKYNKIQISENVKKMF